LQRRAIVPLSYCAETITSITHLRRDSKEQIDQQGANGVWHTSNEYNAQGKLYCSNVQTGVTKAYVYGAAGNATFAIESSGADLSAYTLLGMLHGFLLNLDIANSF